MNRLKAPSPGLAFGRPALKSGKKRGGGPSLLMAHCPSFFPPCFFCPNPFTHDNHDRIQLQRTPLPPSARPIPAPAPFRASAGRVCEQPAVSGGRREERRQSRPGDARTTRSARARVYCVVLRACSCIVVPVGASFTSPHRASSGSAVGLLPGVFAGLNRPTHHLLKLPPRPYQQNTDRRGEAVRGFDWRSQS